MAEARPQCVVYSGPVLICCYVAPFLCVVFLFGLLQNLNRFLTGAVRFAGEGKAR